MTDFATDSARYAALKVWLLTQGIVKLHPTLGDGEPFAIGNHFYGDTFDDAVDTLPKFNPETPRRQ